MDPVTALSVAAAAVGFFDCAYGLLKDYKEVRSTGETLTTKSFEKSANDLVAYGKALQQRPTFSVTSNDPLVEHQKALDRVLHESASIATQLLEAINSLKPKAESARWTSFCQALKTTWKTKDLQKMRDQLESCRTDLAIHILGYLNAKSDVNAAQQGRQLSVLQEGNREIVDILTVIHADILERLARQDADAQRRSGQNDAVQQQVTSGIIEAIFTFKDGNKQSLSPNTGSSTSPQDYKLGNIMTIQAETKDMAASSRLCKTFEWVYRPPKDEGPLWSDLNKWLEEGDGCYWISGKAASGKSTLMKFIYTHPKFSNHLHRWAGNLPLITASFFFWFLGTSLQKSQVGLLRALLFEILSGRPELIPTVMPELCREASKLNPIDRLADPTLTEVTRWFERLVDVTAQTHRICITLDGLDEFDGDHGSLLEVLLRMVATSPSIKFLVSSRPITACMQAFGAFPHLRLQDLNAKDIRQYAEDLLKLQLQSVADTACTDIIDDIVEKSSGVFLWVSLVAKSLLVGVRDGDTGDELKARLEELPTDIRALYQHMMDRIPLTYRAHASEIFQLLIVNQQGPRGDHFFEALTPLQLSFALENWTSVVEYEIETITAESISMRSLRIEARINSRCLGLVEVRSHSGSDKYDQSYRDETVQFIHKSAFEFLNESATYQMLEGLTRPSSFDPFASLFWSCILLAKSNKKQKAVNLDSKDPTWGNVWQALSLASLAEAQDHPLDPKYLLEYDRVLQSSWTSAELWTTLEPGRPTAPMLSRRGHWSNMMLIAVSVPSNRRANGPPTVRNTPFPETRDMVHSCCFGVKGRISCVLLDDDVRRRWEFHEGRRGLLFIAISFSLPSFISFHFDNTSDIHAQKGMITQSEDDATFLLEFLVMRILSCDFTRDSLLCTENDVMMAVCLLRNGAEPNHNLDLAQIGDNEEGGCVVRGFSIWVLCLFLLDIHVRKKHSAESLEPAIVEKLLRLFVVQGADVSTRIEFSTGSFSPPEMVAVTIEELQTRQQHKTDSAQLSASLEKVRFAMLEKTKYSQHEKQQDSPPRYEKRLVLKIQSHDETSLASSLLSKKNSLLDRTRVLFRKRRKSSIGQTK
ncbi:hypothetical protein F5Y18DRAFT_444738 [Xylariaceae sp. FL1019]|nr:hypothetical protein F5Y18DRAFT_444738 [Xylariaceae sp. FL1019]